MPCSAAEKRGLWRWILGVHLQEFIRVGYYVNNEYPESEEQLREEPPEKPILEKCACLPICIASLAKNAFWEGTILLCCLVNLTCSTAVYAMPLISLYVMLAMKILLTFRCWMVILKLARLTVAKLTIFVSGAG
jgi:hypothetical protein